MSTTLESPPNGEATQENPYVKITPKAPPSVPTGPRAPHIEAWVDIEEYPEHKARVWVNFSASLMAEMNSRDQERIYAALRQIVLEHNGWLDENGTPYPPANDPAFWDALPIHLASRAMQAVMERATGSPLARPTQRRSVST